jgi:hypothetical protein
VLYMKRWVLIQQMFNLVFSFFILDARRIRDSFRMIICLRRDASLLKHISLLFTRSPSYGYIRFWIIEGIHCLL